MFATLKLHLQPINEMGKLKRCFPTKATQLVALHAPCLR